MGGVNILTPAVGQWVDTEDDDKLYTERMILVQIACTTTAEFVEILRMSKNIMSGLKCMDLN